MYTLLKPLQVRDKLLEKEIRIFTPQIFVKIFDSSPQASKYFLETQTNEGLLVRLKKGMYMLKSDPPSETEIANAIYRPSYISFEYALAYYGLLPEFPYTITSATTKPTRLFTVHVNTYSYRKIKKGTYTGYSLIQNNDQSFLIADKEKALIDYLYFVSLGRAMHNDRLFQTLKGSINHKKVHDYSLLYKSRSLQTLIKTIL